MTTPGPPEPLAPVAGLVDNLGNQVLDTALDLAPVLVPFVLAMTAVGWVLRKFGLKGSAGLTSGGIEAPPPRSREDSDYDRRIRREREYDESPDRFH